MKIIKHPTKQQLTEALHRPAIDRENLDAVVSDILKNVKTNGDAALHEYTFRFDGVEIENRLVSSDEMKQAENALPEKLKTAIRQAAKNIHTFHAAQVEPIRKIETMPGVVCWRKSVGIERVGLYIPGGTAPLFSTVLMLGIPAQIAGCQEVVLCTPPAKDGRVHPAILFAARVAGISRIYKVGGAQAIAALAYGTETIPAVRKIFGPGNRYVTAAKQLVQKDGIAIDMPAGPSEVMVFADETCVPTFVAADLLSQAEHDVDSQVVFLTTSETVLEQVLKQVDVQTKMLPRQKMLQAALSHSVAVLLENEEKALEAINLYAPEHLILACEKAADMADKVVNAGSVFLGNYTPEAAGDYASGTNHTLPTNGFARSYSGVSVDSFVKKITFQQITREGIQSLGPTILEMAEAEQLPAHALAVSLRTMEVDFKPAEKLSNEH
ncbi:MAG: histidinol dehydrogenase [Lewinellaceae bacterium]|nr:histidinol dehydrogenase [Saprospiraceae bacterium]MCB9339322.1 histidinol dehydrogenase [Lewinellaceae bacterium]